MKEIIRKYIFDETCLIDCIAIEKSTNVLLLEFEEYEYVFSQFKEYPFDDIFMHDILHFILKKDTFPLPRMKQNHKMLM